MVAKVDVINRSLRLIGETPITSFDAPDTNAGKHQCAVYNQSRRELLELIPWNFAEAWKNIDITTAPPFNYDDAYALPEDFLRLLVVGDMVSDEADYRLLYQGSPDYRRVIALNNDGASTLQIAYTADVELLNLWSPLALKALALWIAFDTIMPLTGDADKAKLLNAQLTEALKEAAGSDASQQRIRVHRTSNVQAARNSSQYPNGYPFVDVDFSY